MGKHLLLVAGAIVSALLLYMYPTLNSFENEDQITFNIAYKSVHNFVNTARNKGYITPTMYEDLQREISATGNIFDIEMLHQQKKVIPVFEDPLDSTTFTGEFQVHYDEYYTDQILSVLFPDTPYDKTDPRRFYYMSIGDHFQVIVSNRNYTKATVLRTRLLNAELDNPTRIYIPAGGMIHNEDY